MGTGLSKRDGNNFDMSLKVYLCAEITSLKMF